MFMYLLTKVNFYAEINLFEFCGFFSKTDCPAEVKKKSLSSRLFTHS